MIVKFFDLTKHIKVKLIFLFYGANKGLIDEVINKISQQFLIIILSITKRAKY